MKRILASVAVVFVLVLSLSMFLFADNSVNELSQANEGLVDVSVHVLESSFVFEYVEDIDLTEDDKAKIEFEVREALVRYHLENPDILEEHLNIPYGTEVTNPDNIPDTPWFLTPVDDTGSSSDSLVLVYDSKEAFEAAQEANSYALVKR